MGYSGESMKDRVAMYGIEIETAGRKSKKTFEVEPKRWIAERTFAWLRRNRRLPKDYEFHQETAENYLYLSMNLLTTRRDLYVSVNCLETPS